MPARRLSGRIMIRSRRTQLHSAKNRRVTRGPPSGNVTVDVDGALHATITSTSDSVHSGFIISAPQERIGLPQAPLGTVRFRVTFTNPGVYPYICALHDDLGMKGRIIVLP